MNIDIIDPDPEADISRFEQTVKMVFDSEQMQVSFINIIFLSKDDLRKMKHQFFGQDVYTDVISFNLNEPQTPIEGEVYLSIKQIKENSIEFKTDQADELHRVLIHGCLHLCGYEDDKPELKQNMTRLEDRYLGMIDRLEN